MSKAIYSNTENLLSELAYIRQHLAQLDASNRDADSISEFCVRHRISRAYYYVLRAQGLGPREMRLGSRVLITREAQRHWRRERENATNSEADA